MQNSDSELEYRFTEFMRVERQLSPQTVLNYQRDLERVRHTLETIEFSGWLHLKERPLRFAIAELHAEGLSGRSLQRMLSALRSFYRYLNRAKQCDHNPAIAIKAPKAPRRLPQTLTSETLGRRHVFHDAATRGLQAGRSLADQGCPLDSRPDLAGIGCSRLRRPGHLALIACRCVRRQLGGKRLHGRNAAIGAASHAAKQSIQNFVFARIGRDLLFHGLHLQVMQLLLAVSSNRLLIPRQPLAKRLPEIAARQQAGSQAQRRLRFGVIPRITE